MKQYKYYIIVLVAVLLAACAEDSANFDNKSYIKEENRSSTIFIKIDTPDITKKFKTELARPAEQILNFEYGVNTQLIALYNKKEGVEAQLLSNDHFEIVQANTEILKGAVTSVNEFEILFKNLGTLDREQVYLLPIEMKKADIAPLNSAKSYLYIFKGAALINVVADISENYLSIDWNNNEPCNRLDKITMEALIYPYKFDKMISTVMGIEGQFLIRLGDAGFPSNQIQIATSAGNFPARDASKGLPTNEWVHIALTLDVKSKAYVIYVNGKKQSSGEFDLKESAVNLGSGGFHIGYSWNDERWLDGQISECRIWSIVRSQDEIANSKYGVDPSSEGLVAYWKFDDGEGTLVKDHTEYGNHAKAVKNLKWFDVTLPVPEY